MDLKQMNLEINSYNPDYLNGVLNLWKNCSLIVSQNDPIEDIQKKLDFQPDLFFIGLLQGRVIGTVIAGYDGHRGWLNYLAVLPEYQRRGFGKQLVDRAVDALRALGCLKVNVQVRTSNVSVVDFYRNIGFLEEDRVSLGMRL